MSNIQLPPVGVAQLVFPQFKQADFISVFDAAQRYKANQVQLAEAQRQQQARQLLGQYLTAPGDQQQQVGRQLAQIAPEEYLQAQDFAAKQQAQQREQLGRQFVIGSNLIRSFEALPEQSRQQRYPEFMAQAQRFAPELARALPQQYDPNAINAARDVFTGGAFAVTHKEDADAIGRELINRGFIPGTPRYQAEADRLYARERQTAETRARKAGQTIVVGGQSPLTTAVTGKVQERIIANNDALGQLGAVLATPSFNEQFGVLAIPKAWALAQKSRIGQASESDRQFLEERQNILAPIELATSSQLKEEIGSGRTAVELAALKNTIVSPTTDPITARTALLRMMRSLTEINIARETYLNSGLSTQGKSFRSYFSEQEKRLPSVPTRDVVNRLGETLRAQGVPEEQIVDDLVRAFPNLRPRQ